MRKHEEHPFEDHLVGNVSPDNQTPYILGSCKDAHGLGWILPSQVWCIVCAEMSRTGQSQARTTVQEVRPLPICLRILLQEEARRKLHREIFCPFPCRCDRRPARLILGRLFDGHLLDMQDPTSSQHLPAFRHLSPCPPPEHCRSSVWRTTNPCRTGLGSPCDLGCGSQTMSGYVWELSLQLQSSITCVLQTFGCRIV